MGSGQFAGKRGLLLGKSQLGLGGGQLQHGQARAGGEGQFGDGDFASGEEDAFGGDAALQPETRSAREGLGEADLDASATLSAKGDFGLEFGIGQATEAGGASLGFGDQLAGGREFGILFKGETRGGLGGEGRLGGGEAREHA